MSGQTPLRRQAISELLDALRTHGGVRVVTGEPGCGRTTFLEHAARSFRAGPVWHVRHPGGLHTLLRAAGHSVPGPVPGPGSEGMDDPVGEALFEALRAAAGAGPLLMCVDDAHLWDAASRSALGHAAGRVHSAGIRAGLLLTVPGHRPVDRELAALPVLPLGPLTAGDAARLADDATDGAVHPAVREELVTAAEGNPALLLALVHRLSPAQLGGGRALPRPLADGEVLAGVAGGCLAGVRPDHCGLLLATAAALRATGEPDADADLVLRAGEAFAAGPLPEVLVRAGSRLRFRSALPGRAVYAGAPPERRRAAHHALAGALPDPEGILALLHRSWTVTDHAPALAARLARAAADPAPALPPALRRRALTRAAALTPDDTERVRHCTAAAGQAVLAGHWPEVLRLLDAARSSPAPPSARGAAELLRGAVLLADGPVDDARESFLLAADLLTATDREAAATATLGAADAAWSAGDPAACLEALTSAPRPPVTPPAGGEPTSAAPDPSPSGTSAPPSASVRLPLTSATDAPPGQAVPATDATPATPAPPVAAPAVGTSADGPGWFPVPGRGVAGVPGSAVSSLVGEEAWGVAGGGAPAAGGMSGAVGPPISRSSETAPATGVPDAADGFWPFPVPGRGSAGASDAVVPSAGGRQAPGARTGAIVGSSHEGLLRDHREGMRAVLLGRFDQAAVLLRRVVEQGLRGDEPQLLMRSAAAALMLGEVTAARRAGARALAAARTLGSAALEPRALEYLAYAELRAGRHQLARTHAEEGLRTASRTGQRNTAAHHHAVLALAASIEGEKEIVADPAAAALRTARRHGLAQAATLAQWAAARADLGAGRPREAADRLGPLVRPGARRGHFAVWMLAVPCFVEAAALAGRPEQARAVVEDFALWAACGADPQAPAQLMRCRALLAAPEAADALYLRALDRHEQMAGDFEWARTELLYGKWLRRRRRLREARARLGEALLGFEQCGARPWAQQTAAELRAGGAAPAGTGAGELSLLTPQQLRIARCVAEGATNREVALSLSVSTRTVDYHLRNVFATLGVRSRVELVRLVEQGEKTGAQL
ncbi:LuxR C-terminal-related transcriptional regulator [Streptomyces sp. NPDC006967]|uniref:LuxR C-terminal-related transcriptional regulator n=3 Tax=unclassified Streptomyces TaxID=2593676 RepID=UPI0033D348E3